MDINKFNIRVYGLLIDDGNILVTDEFRLGIFMTKFPGGGLQFGEGPVDCLRREFMEELGMKVIDYSHFYTTEFFQATTLLPSEYQLINIYYRVILEKPYTFKITDKKYNFPEVVDGAQGFRWVKINELTEEMFTFPIDKKIVKMIKNLLGQNE